MEVGTERQNSWKYSPMASWECASWPETGQERNQRMHASVCGCSGCSRGALGWEAQQNSEHRSTTFKDFGAAIASHPPSLSIYSSGTPISLRILVPGLHPLLPPAHFISTSHQLTPHSHENRGFRHLSRPSRSATMFYSSLETGSKPGSLYSLRVLDSVLQEKFSNNK